MFVKPGMRPDDRGRALVVRGPNGRLLSELGGEVPETQFWHRRLRDGDVVSAEPLPMDGEVRHVAADGSVTIVPAEGEVSFEGGTLQALPALTAEAAR